MSDDAQLSFRVSSAMSQNFKSKAKASGQRHTTVLRGFVEQYLKSDGNTSNPASPNVVEVPSTHSAHRSEVLGNEHRLDSIERLVTSMLDTTALTNRMASLEFRFVDLINLLEKRLLPTAGYDPTFPTSNSQRAVGSPIPESSTPLLDRVAKVEELLANCMAGQQLLEQGTHQAIAEFKANIEELLATQLADHNAQLLELQQSLAARHDESLASLTEMKVNLVGQLDQHLVQIPALTEAVANLQQQVQATKPPALLATTPESSTPSKEAVPVSKARKVKGAQQQAKPLVSQPENTSTASSDAAKQPTSEKKAVRQRGKQSTPSSVTVDGDSVVIDGARKKLLHSIEAFAIAQQKGYRGDNRQFVRLAERKSLEEAYRLLGLGVVPELRGKRGERRAWFYAL